MKFGDSVLCRSPASDAAAPGREDTAQKYADFLACVRTGPRDSMATANMRKSRAPLMTVISASHGLRFEK